jgi:hypothetical protein
MILASVLQPLQTCTERTVPRDGANASHRKVSSYDFYEHIVLTTFQMHTRLHSPAATHRP